MKRFTLLLFLVVGTLVVSLASLVTRQVLRTPREVLTEVQSAIREGSQDEEVLLRHLDSTLRQLHTGGESQPRDEDLEVELTLTRGRLLLSIGATDKARADFQKVLRDFLPGDPEVRRLLIDAERAQGHRLVALEHLKLLIEDAPEFGSGWVELGLLLQEMAEETLDVCSEKLSYALVEEDAKTAMGLLRQLAARDPSDTRRSTTIFRLRQLFPSSAQEVYGQVLGLCAEANEHLVACREALVHSFSLVYDPHAMAQYLSILESAGQHREALQLGSMVALDQSDDAGPESAMLLMRILLDRGDAHHAGQLASNWVNRDRPLPIPFLRLCCEALYQDQQWSRLVIAALRLRSIGTPEDSTVVSFYIGLNHANSPKPDTAEALAILGEFTRSTANEPFPGARVKAWRTLVRLHHESGNTSAEREALSAVLILEPDAGDLWLRSAEIQRETKHGGYALPLDSWVKGMTLLPKRSDELMETFIALGERRLVAEERDLRVLYDNLKRAGRSAPKRDYGPYVLWRIAQMHGKAFHPMLQLAAAQRLAEQHPDFIPALDQQIEARYALHDREQYLELVLKRVALTGVTERGAELLATLSVEEYSAQQLLDIIQLDPKGTGRLVAAMWYRDNGENALALKTLKLAGRQARSDAERYFGAELLLSNGDARGALLWLSEISSESSFYPRMLRLSVTAAAQLNDTQVLGQHLTTLIRAEKLSIVVLLDIADELLRNHQIAAARYVIKAIPLEYVEDPGPLFLREVQLYLAEGKLDLAEEAIERSGAFVNDAEYALSRLLLLSYRGDRVSARGSAADLAQLGFGSTPESRLWLDLCTEHDEQALEVAQAAQASQPEVARWVVAANIAQLSLGRDVQTPAIYGRVAGIEMQRFLLGNGQNIFDPRQIAVLMLAAGSPEFRSFVFGTLRHMPRAQRGLLWAGILSANLASEQGELVDATAAHNRVVKAFPDCAVAWNELLLATIERYGSTLHSQVDQVLVRQLLAQAKDDEESAAALLVQGYRARSQGDLNAALQSFLAASEKAPDWFEAKSAQASLNVQLGQWDLAFETWRGLVARADPVLQPRALQGLIGALDSAIVLDPPPLPLVDLKRELDAIEHDFPGIPTCSLALARLDLALDLDNPALGLERAWGRLKRLRHGREEVSLESLERGSTQAWANFYVNTDPGSAEEFIRGELQLQPGNLELWRLLGRVHRDLGNFEEARRVLTQVTLIAANTQVAEELAAAQMASGATPTTMARTLKQLGLKTTENSLTGQLLYAESLLNEYNRNSWAAAIVKLEELWNGRQSLEDVEQRNRVAQLFGRSLLLRGEDQDAEHAVEILQSQLPHTRVPYQREEFQCLIGIGQARSKLTE